MKDVFELKKIHTTYGQNQITLHVEMLRLLSSIVIEGARALFLFFKCILNKAKIEKINYSFKKHKSI